MACPCWRASKEQLARQQGRAFRYNLLPVRKNERPILNTLPHPTPPILTKPPQAKGFPLQSLTQPKSCCNFSNGGQSITVSTTPATPRAPTLETFSATAYSSRHPPRPNP
ncbi:MAG: hypothetical protein LBQ31_01405 [Bacteroidales bacterium]|nr:hypothetical protein [Bacteroidales bacterium]